MKIILMKKEVYSIFYYLMMKLINFDNILYELMFIIYLIFNNYLFYIILIVIKS